MFVLFFFSSREGSRVGDDLGAVELDSHVVAEGVPPLAEEVAHLHAHHRAALRSARRRRRGGDGAANLQQRPRFGDDW